MQCSNPLANGIVRFSERQYLRMLLIAWLIRRGRITEWPETSEVKAITRVSSH